MSTPGSERTGPERARLDWRWVRTDLEFGGNGRARPTLSALEEELRASELWRFAGLGRRGRTLLLKGPAPSSHILRFDNRDFERLAVNEVMVLRLAEAVGLPTVRAGPPRTNASPSAQSAGKPVVAQARRNIQRS